MISAYAILALMKGLNMTDADYAIIALQKFIKEYEFVLDENFLESTNEEIDRLEKASQSEKENGKLGGDYDDARD